jgi:hypothetical protein
MQSQYKHPKYNNSQYELPLNGKYHKLEDLFEQTWKSSPLLGCKDYSDARIMAKDNSTQYQVHKAILTKVPPLRNQIGVEYPNPLIMADITHTSLMIVLRIAYGWQRINHHKYLLFSPGTLMDSMEEIYAWGWKQLVISELWHILAVQRTTKSLTIAERARSIELAMKFGIHLHISTKDTINECVVLLDSKTRQFLFDILEQMTTCANEHKADSVYKRLIELRQL